MYLKSKNLLTILAVVCMSLGPVSSLAAGGKLVQLLIHEAQTADFLVKNGIEELPAQRASKDIQLAWKHLSPNGQVPKSAEEAKQILEQLDAGPQDSQTLGRLYRILNKQQDQVTKQDIHNMYNDLAYITNKYSSMIAACQACMSESMAKSGFAYTLKEIQNQNTRELLESVIPKKPRELRNFISHRLSKNSLGSLEKSSGIVRSEDEKALAIFLGLLENGNQAQKELAQAVVNFSKTPSGDVRLVNPNNPHKFWKLFLEDMDDETMKGWSRALNRVAKESGDVEDKQKAFYAHLAKRADDDPELNGLLQTLKKRNCFFAK